MSQSDYIKFKRVSTVLRKNDQPPVMETKNYVDFKEFTLVNSIPNTKVIKNLLTLPNRQIVFDMSKMVSNCPSFPLCENTNMRTNRIPMSGVYFTPTPQPKTIKDTKNATHMKNACKCILNSKNTDTNICSCRTGNWGIVR
jgi:hypothetical protein